MYQRGHQKILLISQILSKKESLKIHVPKGSNHLNLVNITDIKKKRKFEDTCTKGVIRNLVNITDIKEKKKV